MSSRVSVVMTVAAMVAFAVLARFTHAQFVSPEGEVGSAAIKYVLLAGLVLMAVGLLVYAYRSVKARQSSASDWGLLLSGKVWYSIPIIITVVALSSVGKESSPHSSSSHIIVGLCLLFMSSVILRAFCMRLIIERWGNGAAVPVLSVVITGCICALVHPDPHATIMGDVASNCLSSSFVPITGSVLASFTCDAVRLLNPSMSQASIQMLLAGGVIYVVFAGLIRQAEH